MPVDNNNNLPKVTSANENVSLEPENVVPSMQQNLGDGISITDKTRLVWNDYESRGTDSIYRYGDSSAFGAEGQQDFEMDNDEDY